MNTPSEEDVAREVSEDRRLVRLGIDPDADPFDIRRAVKQKKIELQALIEAEAAEIEAYRAEQAAKKIDTPPGE